MTVLSWKTVSRAPKDDSASGDTYRSEIDTDNTHLDVRKKKYRGIIVRRVRKVAGVSEKPGRCEWTSAVAEAVQTADWGVDVQSREGERDEVKQQTVRCVWNFPDDSMSWQILIGYPRTCSHTSLSTSTSSIILRLAIFYCRWLDTESNL